MEVDTLSMCCVVHSKKASVLVYLPPQAAAGASAPSTRITYPGRVVGFLSTFAVNFAQQHEWSAQDMRSRRLLHGGPAMGIGTRESFWPSRVNLSACAYGRAYKINLIGIPSLRGVCQFALEFLGWQSCHETVATEEAPRWFEGMEFLVGRASKSSY